jgi:hypothetical protein
VLQEHDIYLITHFRYYLKDKDVTLDSELGKFANQLSADGAGKNGGIGMVRSVIKL